MTLLTEGRNEMEGQTTGLIPGANFIIPGVECPHCGYKNRVSRSNYTSASRATLVTCDVDSGGCDNQFLLWAELNARVWTAKAVLP